MPLGNFLLLSPTFWFKRCIVATAEMRWMELAGLTSVWGTYWLIPIKKNYENCVLYIAQRSKFSLFSNIVPTFAGRWEVPWSWIPTAFAGRRNAWQGSRLSSARHNQKSSVRWPKEQGWVSESASTSSGTAGGIAQATTNTLAKYFSKVSKERISHLIILWKQFELLFTLKLSLTHLSLY